MSKLADIEEPFRNMYIAEKEQEIRRKMFAAGIRGDGKTPDQPCHFGEALTLLYRIKADM